MSRMSSAEFWPVVVWQTAHKVSTLCSNRVSLHEVPPWATSNELRHAGDAAVHRNMNKRALRL
eukprot:11107208-Heterocapsa_arctica.AAC.1